MSDCDHPQHRGLIDECPTAEPDWTLTEQDARELDEWMNATFGPTMAKSWEELPEQEREALTHRIALLGLLPPGRPPVTAGREQDAREGLTDVLVAHQRKDIGSCLCGWSELGLSHARHQADAALAVLALATTGADEVEVGNAIRRGLKVRLDDDVQVFLVAEDVHDAIRPVLAASPPATDGDTAGLCTCMGSAVGPHTHEPAAPRDTGTGTP